MPAILGGIIANIVKNVIVAKATQAIEEHDAVLPGSKKVSPATPAETAKTLSTDMTSDVVDALKANKSVAIAINGEPWYKSKFLWLGVAGTLSSLGTLVTMVSNHSTDFAAYSTAVAALVTSIGTIARRAALQN